ncbi:MAG: CocE/NonD family hydrolase [Bryobacteraceae bacterium]
MRRIFLLLLAAGAVSAQNTEAAKKEKERFEYIKANYTKYEFMVPMRDGIKLFVSVYAPKDTAQKYPIWINRTPYEVAPYGIDNYRRTLGPSESFVKEGFIFAYCDVRGKGKSEGKYVNVRPIVPVKKSPKDIDESTDTYDTIDWLVKNVPNNNGRVGISGISYPGFYAMMGAIEAHPALKAASPQAPVYDWFVGDDFRHNGALFLAHAFNFFSGFGRKGPQDDEVQGPRFGFSTPDGYDFFLRMGPLSNADERHFKGQIEFWRELLDNDTYNAFWKSRVARPYLVNVKPAMMTVGGWFDAEDVHGPLKCFESVEKQSGSTPNMLVMGPWWHGQWSGHDGSYVGNINWGQKTGEFYREKIEFPFFLHHLKEKGDPKLPKAYVFETGRNQWRRHDTWPPADARQRTYYFHAAGKLTDQAPSEASALDEYISDPAKPVPHRAEFSPQMNYDYMTDDQRFASRRTDVLAYQTDALEGDVTVAGPLRVSLWASTTGTDSDFVVKLVDVYPGNAPNPDPNPRRLEMGGYQQLVRGEPFRGRFRNSFERPEAFEPGKPAKIEFEMPDVYHTFRRGHRMMVHVQSSWFPLVDRNPQKFVKIFTAKEADFQKATQRVYRSAKMPSGLTVRVLP